MKAKKFLSLLLAFSTMLVLAVSTSANGSLYTYDPSDETFWDLSLNDADEEELAGKCLWLDNEHMLLDWGRAVYNEESAAATGTVTADADGFFIPNDLTSLPVGWYECAFAGFGTADDFAEADVNGKLAITLRGTANFTEKAVNAMDAGAVGVLILNNFTNGADAHDEEGNITTAMNANMAVTQDAIPQALLDSDATIYILTAMTGASAADVTAAIDACVAGEVFSLPIQNEYWVYFGSQAEFLAAGEPTATTVVPSTETEPATEPETEPAETEPAAAAPTEPTTVYLNFSNEGPGWGNTPDPFALDLTAVGDTQSSEEGLVDGGTYTIYDDTENVTRYMHITPDTPITNQCMGADDSGPHDFIFHKVGDDQWTIESVSWPGHFITTNDEVGAHPQLDVTDNADEAGVFTITMDTEYPGYYYVSWVIGGEETTPAATEPETEPETAPETEPEAVETEPETEPELVEPAETVPTAPAETASQTPAAQTFDVAVIAAVAAVVSGAGYAISKKRR